MAGSEFRVRSSAFLAPGSWNPEPGTRNPELLTSAAFDADTLAAQDRNSPVVKARISR
jgi:hypothetical protein